MTTRRKIVCVGCTGAIEDLHYLNCCKCKGSYDLVCANVTEHRFTKVLTKTQKESWICCECISNRPKTDNSNTPVHGNYDGSQNVTQRRGGSMRNVGIELLQDEPTVTSPLPLHSPEKCNQTLLGNISTLLDEKLTKNREQILSEIQETVLTKINECMNNFRMEFNKDIVKLTKNQSSLEEQVNQMTEKLQNLETENKKLQQELQENNGPPKQLTSTKQIQNELNKKKIILHGLLENQYESEYEIHNQIINIFRDITNVDLVGYIEEVGRIGKPGKTRNQRPVYIELLSKKMTQYILQNARKFQGTSLSITEFLSEDSLQERKVLREKLVAARKSGSYAIIRNNKLIVDGVIVPVRITDQHYKARPSSSVTDPRASRYENNDNTMVAPTRRTDQIAVPIGGRDEHHQPRPSASSSPSSSITDPRTNRHQSNPTAKNYSFRS